MKYFLYENVDLIEYLWYGTEERLIVDMCSEYNVDEMLWIDCTECLSVPLSYMWEETNWGLADIV